MIAPLDFMNITMQISTLTDTTKALYPVTVRKGGEGFTMRGIIRTREKCGHCGENYVDGFIGREMDLVCSCGRHPRKYYIYLYHDGDHKIVRDKTDSQLASYTQANRLLERIRSEIDAKTFDVTEYKQKTRQQFNAHRLILKWYKSKCKKGLAPTTRKDYRGYIRNYFSPIAQKLKIDDCRMIRTYHNVLASIIRHEDTPYDRLMDHIWGVGSKRDARKMVRHIIDEKMNDAKGDSA